jgi:uncharacterized protein (UPF0210 family)
MKEITLSIDLNKELHNDSTRLISDMLDKVLNLTKVREADGVHYDRELMFAILTKYTAVLSCAILTSGTRNLSAKKLSEKEIQKQGEKMYLEFKNRIERCVGEGFSRGVEQYSGVALEMYAKILCAQEMLSKASN